MKTETSLETIYHSLETKVKGKIEKKSGKRIGYYYIIIRSIKESPKNDVVKCLYIKGILNFGFCIIKEGTYGDTRDKYGRDIKDRLLWQKKLHEELQGKIRLPKLLGSFEENGNYYLVLDCIRGRSLDKEWKKYSRKIRQGLINGNKMGLKFLNYILQIIDLIELLHKNHYVHRDITPNNFMISPKGKVYLIDMELSYSLKQKSPAPPFELGTYGYMSPEQKIAQTPTIKEDVFSIGAIIIRMWTGISPNKITDAPASELSSKVSFLLPDQHLANMVLQCLDSNPEKRPSLHTLRETVIQHQTSLKKKVARCSSHSFYYEKTVIPDIIQSGINTLGSPLLADEQGWFSESIEGRPVGEKNKINKAWYTGVNRGVSGIIYLLGKAHGLGLNVEQNLPVIEKGLKLIEEKYFNDYNNTSSGLHFGSAGVAVSLATAIKYSLPGIKKEYNNWISPLLSGINNMLGYMHGISGQGIANLLCKTFLTDKESPDRLHNYVHQIMSFQDTNGSWTKDRTGKTKKISLGFTNGIAGIAYFLLEYGEQYRDQNAINGAERALDFLIKKAARRKNTLQWYTDSHKELMHWWCEGTAGFALVFMKAYSITGEIKYKKYASEALYNHDPKVLDNNLSQCHGLSGLGEIYLEGYRLLRDDEWLERADWIAQVILHLKKVHPVHGCYWLVQSEKQPVADFMVGNSGILHFLLRYNYGEKVRYPLLP